MGTFYETLLRRNGVKLSEDQEIYRRSIVFPPEFRWDSNSHFSAVRPKRRPKAFAADGRRVCCSCLKAKDPECYHRRKSSVDGRDPRCKDCKRQLRRMA